LKSIEKLAVDANPILSAIIGGNARNVFLAAESISFYTTAFNYREVEKYIPVLAKKRTLPLDDLHLSLSMLPVFVYEEEFYIKKMKGARALIGSRDVKDAHLLALALKLGSPAWSNDKDFGGLGVKVYTTLELMKML